MTARIYYENDASIDVLRDLRIVVVGYGSQGRAHSLNLKDSGLDICVALRKDSPSWDRASSEGVEVRPLHEALPQANLVAMLVPDQHQPSVYRDVVMVAPKAPGLLVRRTFEQGSGTPALVAVHQDASGAALGRALAYAKGIGCTRAGVIETTFAEETETDLFGEQAVLCGGTSALVKAGFETLIEAGYQPEIAYFECLHELKLIVDLMYRGGLQYMRYSISDTAEYGDYVSGARIVTAETKATMRQLLKEIQNGEFAKNWIAENETGSQNFKAMRERDRNHPIEIVGSKLRDM